MQRTGGLATGAAQVPRERIARALALAGEALLAEIGRRTPVGASGNLRGSLGHTREVLGDEVRSILSANARYALAVETGARPHFPPVQDLIPWVKAKLSFRSASPKRKREIRRQAKTAGAPAPRDESEKELRSMAFLVARAISRRGTSARGVREGPTGGRGYFMFEDSTDEMMDRIEERFLRPLGLEIVRDLES